MLKFEKVKERICFECVFCCTLHYCRIVLNWCFYFLWYFFFLLKYLKLSWLFLGIKFSSLDFLFFFGKYLVLVYSHIVTTNPTRHFISWLKMTSICYWAIVLLSYSIILLSLTPGWVRRLRFCIVKWGRCRLCI